MNDTDDKRILIAEPDRTIANTLREFLVHAGYCAMLVDDRNLITQTAVDNNCGVVLVDHLFNASSGTDVTEELHHADPSICAVILMSYPLVEFVVSAFRRGAFDVVIKPVDLFELDRIVSRAFRQNRLNRAFQYVRRNLEKIEEIIKSEDDLSARKVFEIVP